MCYVINSGINGRFSLDLCQNFQIQIALKIVNHFYKKKSKQKYRNRQF